MNIFVLDQDPVIASRMLCDCHVRKMIVESCQLLSTHDRITNRHDDLSGLYKPTHENHPCRRCLYNEANRKWLICYVNALAYEYTYRFSKWHKCTELIHRYWFSPETDALITQGGSLIYDGHVYAIQKNLTLPRVMPTVFIAGPDTLDSVVASYRAYYSTDKKEQLLNTNKGNMWSFTNRDDWTT